MQADQLAIDIGIAVIGVWHRLKDFNGKGKQKKDMIERYAVQLPWPDLASKAQGDSYRPAKQLNAT